MINSTAFKSLIAPSSTRPEKTPTQAKAAGLTILRDQLSITGWLASGALAQGILILVIGRLALLPAVLYILYNIANTYAITTGLRKNPYMDGVLMNKYSAQIPDSNGGFSDKPADSDVTVLLIGTRVNHPLGILAPGFKELGGYFTGMAATLAEHAEEFDYLGMTTWTSSDQRETKNELLSICYFRTTEGLYKFAHSEYHRKAWKWWNTTVKNHPHLSIYHETYHVPKGHWETIYANMKPNHLASTTYKYTDKETGEAKWASPVVDASRGILKTGQGRMSRGRGNEHDSYEKSAHEVLA